MLRYNTTEKRLEVYNGVEWKLHVIFSAITNIAYAWGSNASGRLGDDTTTSRLSPVTVVGGITNWSQLSSGGDHSLGLTSTGVAYAWGLNTSGQLGDNTTSSRLSPVTVVGGITNWSQVSAGDIHSLGVTSTGIAYAWGSNDSGRLGDTTATTRSSPVTVVGGITNWTQLSAGGNHSLGVTSTGIAYAWGRNNVGQLGRNNTLNSASPVTVVGGITNWTQLSAGTYHSLGITTTGVAYAWGSNGSGRLGDNTTSSRSSPVTVVGGITTWSQLSSGGSHSLGLTSTGIAYAWGINSSGQLGTNNTSSRSSPVTVVGGITNWSRLSAGDNHSLGVTGTGIAYGWGNNVSGRLGDNTSTTRSSPVTVVGGITSWSQVSAGGDHSLGLRVDVIIR
jgi:alpha-tubulin suppressor-like RCC1 family protein